jgi:hypothetical protein
VLRCVALALGGAMALGGCAEEVAPSAPPRHDAGARPDLGPVENGCSPELMRALAADARHEGDAWVLSADNGDRAVQGALLAPCATAEHVTVWRHGMTREARLEVTVDSADPMETVVWVLDRCEPVLAEPMACAPSAPTDGGARRAATRTTKILQLGAVVFVAVGGARRGPRAGEGPRETAGRFTLRVEERPPTADGAACTAPDGVAECAGGASCQLPEARADAPVCIRDGARNGRCRTEGAACEDGLRCEGGGCRGPVPPGADCHVNDPYACVEGAHCVSLPGGATRCVSDGALGGKCRAAGPACDEPTRCNGAPSSLQSRCEEVLADGDPCDSSDSLAICAEGSSCTYDFNSAGALMWRCLRLGARGAQCRGAEPACDEGLACNGVPGDEATYCLPARGIGETCDAARGLEACVRPAFCIAEGSVGVCRAPPYDDPAPADGEGIDACVTGTTLPIPAAGDSAALPVLPFTVRFFGASFDRVWASPEGYATFGRAPLGSRSAAFPLAGEAPAVAPLLADLRPTARSRLCARVDAAARRLALTWRDFQVGARVGSRLDVSAAIDAAGVVTFQYTAVEPGTDPLTPDAAAPMAAGIQGEGGVLYLRARVVSGTAIRFVHR